MIYPYYRLCETDEEEGHFYYFYDFSDRSIFKTTDERSDLHKEVAKEERNISVKNVVLTVAICFVLYIIDLANSAYHQYYHSTNLLGLYYAKEIIAIIVAFFIWLYFESEKRKKIMKEIKDEAVIVEADPGEINRLVQMRRTGSSYLENDLAVLRVIGSFFFLFMILFRWWALPILVIPILAYAFLKVNMDALPTNSKKLYKTLGESERKSVPEQKTGLLKDDYFNFGEASHIVGMINLLLYVVGGMSTNLVWLILLLSGLGVYMGHIGRRREKDCFIATVGQMINRCMLYTILFGLFFSLYV